MWIAEGRTYQNMGRKRWGDRDSPSGDGRGKVRTWEERGQVRGTHPLETAEGGNMSNLWCVDPGDNQGQPGNRR